MANTASDDELDDILNGIAEGRDEHNNSNTQTQPDFASRKSGNGTGGGDGLGIDEEIIITKQRIPIPKLDDNRLLSNPGIPRLRKISKERLRFKGKGHEYGDIARMLNMYQLWLDDLYPRAKFADALTIIEKVGHTKRMQLMRKDWIDEGKPRRTTAQDDEDEDVEGIATDKATTGEGGKQMEGVTQDAVTQEPEVREEDGPSARDHTSPGSTGAGPDDDELDALLAESAEAESSVPKALPVRTAATEDDPFADAMEAMADMDVMW